MAKIYRPSRGATRLLYKIRHHRGHGIHSPFVFDLITNVIEERSTFYAYEDIKKHLEYFTNITATPNKTHRLLFKLVNRFSAKRILELGSGIGLSTLFLTAHSSETSCVSVELICDKYNSAQMLYKGWERDIKQSNVEFPVLNQKQDCIYVNLRNYKTDSLHLINYLFSSVDDYSFIVMDEIRTNKKSQALWKEIISRENVIISLDLFHLGILFFDKKYYKQNYKLSF